MEKRLIVALVITIAFMALWTWLFPPSRQKPTEPTGGAEPQGEVEILPNQGAPAMETGEGAPREADAPRREEELTLPGLESGAAEASQGARPAGLPEGAVEATLERDIAIDTPLASIRLTNRGARVTSWKLFAYDDDAGEPLDLVSTAGQTLDILPLEFRFQDGEVTRQLKEALYEVEQRESVEDGETVTVVSFTYSDGQGLSAAKTLRIPHTSYVGRFEAVAEVNGKAVTPAVVWGAGFAAENGLNEGGSRFSYGTHGVVKLAGEIDRRPASDVTPDEPWIAAGRIEWAGLENKYFTALLVPPAPVQGQTWVESRQLVEGGVEKFYLSFAFHAPDVTEYRLFVGPKDYDLVKSVDLGLDGLVDFGFFAIIALPLFKALKFVHGYTGNYGWAIALLTIMIRLIFFPFMHRGQLQMRRAQDKMKRVQPKIKAMREHYRKLERKELQKGRPGARQKLRQKMNEDMMALYKEEGINPLGSMSGCLPLLLQMPILFAFYSILSISIELRKAPFVLWIRDLSAKDPYYVTPLVMGATMLLQQVMTSGSIADPTQRRMMYIMPVMFTYFFINLPSGLVLYWLVNNILGIGQQYLVNKEAARKVA